MAVSHSQDGAALWTWSQSKTIFFHSLPSPLAPTTWTVSMAATELLIEILIKNLCDFS